METHPTLDVRKEDVLLSSMCSAGMATGPGWDRGLWSWTAWAHMERLKWKYSLTICSDIIWAQHAKTDGLGFTPDNSEMNKKPPIIHKAKLSKHFHILPFFSEVHHEDKMLRFHLIWKLFGVRWNVFICYHWRIRFLKLVDLLQRRWKPEIKCLDRVLGKGCKKEEFELYVIKTTEPESKRREGKIRGKTKISGGANAFDCHSWCQLLALLAGL